MKLYTKTICPKCIAVKGELEDKGVKYEAINIDHDEEAKELLILHGFAGVPVAEHEGKFYPTVPAIQGLISSL